MLKKKRTHATCYTLETVEKIYHILYIKNNRNTTFYKKKKCVKSTPRDGREKHNSQLT